MKILVCGGRDFSDYPFLSSTLESINPTQIISGGARGKDRGWTWDRRHGKKGHQTRGEGDSPEQGVRDESAIV